MTPLSSWTCDVCGNQITDPTRGLVVWQSTRPDNKGYDFKIVHKTIESDPVPYSCDPGAKQGYVSNLDLNHFLGAEGVTRLLSYLSDGPAAGNPGHARIESLDEFVDLFRRVQTPYYEEARPHFNDELTQHWLSDTNEIYPYLPQVLQRIADGTLG